MPLLSSKKAVAVAGKGKERASFPSNKHALVKESIAELSWLLVSFTAEESKAAETCSCEAYLAAMWQR